MAHQGQLHRVQGSCSIPYKTSVSRWHLPLWEKRRSESGSEVFANDAKKGTSVARGPISSHYSGSRIAPV